MTAAFTLSDYLPSAEPPEVDALRDLSLRVSEAMAGESDKVRLWSRSIVDGMRRLVEQAEADAEGGAPLDLDDMIEQLIAAEEDRGANYIPLVGAMMGLMFQHRRLQRLASQRKAHREVAQSARQAQSLQRHVDALVDALEAIRDSRIKLALIGSRHEEASQGPGPSFSDADDLAAFLKSN